VHAAFLSNLGITAFRLAIEAVVMNLLDVDAKKTDCFYALSQK
jgi:hypothetical protein